MFCSHLPLYYSILICSLLLCELFYPYKRAIVYSLTVALGVCLLLSAVTDNLFLLSLVTIGGTFFLYIAYRLTVQVRKKDASLGYVVLTDTPPNGTALAYRDGSVRAFRNNMPYYLHKGEVLYIRKSSENEKEEVLYHA